jgi:integral membrane protein
MSKNTTNMFKKYFGTTIQSLRVLALWEGVSFLLILFVTMPLKYMADMPEPNKVIGMGHGVLFIAYVAFVILARSEYGFTLKQTFWALVASVLPFGTFVADSRIFKPVQLQKG